MKDLTEKQSQVLKYISSFIKEKRYPPTVREIAAAFKISVKGAYDHLIALQKKQAIQFNSNKSRTIEIIRCDENNESEIIQIPLLGTIAAGIPILSEENLEKRIPIPADFLKTRTQYFALKVRGDSMINAGIFNGDLAIIEHKETAENGDIIVAVANDAITLKRFFKESNRIKLQPENPDFKPMYYQDIRIAGKLATIIRKY